MRCFGNEQQTPCGGIQSVYLSICVGCSVLHWLGSGRYPHYRKSFTHFTYPFTPSHTHFTPTVHTHFTPTVHTHVTPTVHTHVTPTVHTGRACGYAPNSVVGSHAKCNMSSTHNLGPFRLWGVPWSTERGPVKQQLLRQQQLRQQLLRLYLHTAPPYNIHHTAPLHPEPTYNHNIQYPPRHVATQQYKAL